MQQAQLWRWVFILWALQASFTTYSDDTRVAEELAQAEAMYSGAGGPYDPEQAGARFSRLAEQGDHRARLRLAILLKLGKAGFSRDPEAAERWARGTYEQVLALAQAGDPMSQYLLGSCYVFGLGCQQLPSEALPWFEKSAEGGFVMAMQNLSWMYRTGTGVPQNEPRANQWLQRGAEAGGLAMMYNWSVHLIGENRSPGWDSSGMRWLRLAAAKGYPDAMGRLGHLMTLHMGRRPDLQRQGLDWMERAAAAGSRAVFWSLGEAMQLGYGTEPDSVAAVKWFERAALESEDANAMSRLGRIYLHGQGLPRNLDQALHWLSRALLEGDLSVHDALFDLDHQDEDFFPAARRADFLQQIKTAADQGNPYAQVMLSQGYAQGWLGLPLDLEQSGKWAELSVADGDPIALRFLGDYLHYRLPVAQRDIGRAFATFDLCAEKGDPYCMLLLASCLAHGHLDLGIEKDLPAATAWVRKSADRGVQRAMLWLARGYEAGSSGYEKDLELATYWYREAAARGDLEAKGWLVSREQLRASSSELVP